jgi:cytidine deaminase
MVELNEVGVSRLVEAARRAKKAAYAPYSGFRVGAAILCFDGSIFTGCNVENASYGATICAERTAIAKGVSEGHKDIVAIAITSDDDKPCSPCGICRQVIYEFNPEMKVIIAPPGGDSPGEPLIMDALSLLPSAFDFDAGSKGQRSDSSGGW